MSITNNSSKAAKAAALAARVEMFIAQGGTVKVSRANAGPINKYTERKSPVYPQMAIVPKSKSTWSELLEQLRAEGKLTTSLEAIIKAKM